MTEISNLSNFIWGTADLIRDTSAIAGHAFYNTSQYTFVRLLEDYEHLAANLRAYINCFSKNMQEVVEKFDFENTIKRLDDAGLLYQVMER
ncbi:MAG TPA: type I restriction-modification system subunit M N-terminal domain-containing protein, partial [Ktedonobacteraceae bacterium]